MLLSRSLFPGDGNVSFEEFVEIVSNMGPSEAAPTDQDQEEQELRDAFRVGVPFIFPLLLVETWTVCILAKSPARKPAADTNFTGRACCAFNDFTIARSTLSGQVIESGSFQRDFPGRFPALKWMLWDLK